MGSVLPSPDLVIIRPAFVIWVFDQAPVEAE